MILDSFNFDTFIFQLQYKNAFEVWDRAGRIARQLSDIWPELSLVKGQPNIQALAGKGVTLETGLLQSNITLSTVRVLDSTKTGRIKKTFDVWRKELLLADVSRVSSRATFVRDFDSISAAHGYLKDLDLVKMPSVKVFDQPMASERNGFDVTFRFEDDSSFAFLHVFAEQLKIQRSINEEFDKTEVDKTINRVVIDFDRGLLGSVSTEEFRVDEWLKGFIHLLRRDVEKIIKVSP